MPEHPRYKINETIAEGDYAVIYRGEDRELQREIAIKQIHSQFLDDPKQLERYWQEAQLLASLEHPRIMSIYDIVRDRGWLILELMRGSMEQLQDGRPVDLKDLRLIIIWMAKALRFLERNGIVHGDVKPSNILVDKNRHVKLGDFGIARRLSGDDVSLIKGTTKYLSPEVVSDQFGEVGPQSDLYSLGFSAYELMCGKHFETLFPGLDMYGPNRQVAWLMWHSSADLTLPPISQAFEGVPEDLAHVIEKLCKKNPNERYRSADEVLEDLQADPSRPKPPKDDEAEAKQEAEKQQRRKRNLSLAAVGLSAALSLAMIFLPGPKTDDGGNERVPLPREAAVLSVDADENLLIITEENGKQHDVLVDSDRDEIRLNRGSLLQVGEVRNGDKLEIQELFGQDGSVIRRINVVRTDLTKTLQGRLVEVREATNIVRCAADSGEVLEIFVPPDGVSVSLNGRDKTLVGRSVMLGSLQPEDRVTLQYQPRDGGLQAISLAASRTETMDGVVESYQGTDLVSIRFQGGESACVLRTAPDAAITINGYGSDAGRMFQVNDLRPGDRATVVVDAVVRRIEALREEVFQGIVRGVAVGELGGRVRIALDEHNEREFFIPNDCEIHPVDSASSLTLRNVRINDRATLSQIERNLPAANQITARKLELGLTPDAKVCAMVISVSKYRPEESLSNVLAAAADADWIQRGLRDFYRVPANQMLVLTDPRRREAEQEIETFLANSVPANCQLLVYFVGHGYLDRETPYLAFADCQLNDISRYGGMPFAEFIQQLDGCGAAEVTVLLDSHHPGEGRDQVFRASAEKFAVACRTILGWRTAHHVYVLASTRDGQTPEISDDATRSWFARGFVDALNGQADKDQDQRISAKELDGHVSSLVRLETQQPQTPVLIDLRIVDNVPPDYWDQVREMIRTFRAQGLGDDFEVARQAANDTAKGQAEHELVHALALMSDTRKGRLAKEQFGKSLAIDPESLVANLATAWFLFREDQFDQGLRHLKTAVENAPATDAPYFPTVMDFSGRLCGFAANAIARSEVRSGLIGDIRRTIEQDCPQGMQVFTAGGAAAQAKAAGYQADLKQPGANIGMIEINLENITTYTDFDRDAAMRYVESTLR